ncbi:chemotaxis protein CheX [Caldinitratiruptor microaerophilus]|uniref:CheY-P phosphatase CheX n=1 Tax=Caldinitratiruptor microaerophilus TaxID=671077 RepID=A0AA35CKQ2_9FIRM|nr:chemotaxis protein CheX [Caldinitratiruptor microaerophilus]BDG60309.1 CheY-P phosphatase CheX [Caldinitratiruptor microaerophilus]
MDSDLVHSFLVAAHDILTAEDLSPVRVGAVTTVDSPLVSHEVSVLIGMTGRQGGVVVLYGMSGTTAKGLVSVMMGGPVQARDALVQSAVGEIGNMIAGRAAMELAKRGRDVNITPPLIVVGEKRISRSNVRRLVIPFTTSSGDILIHLALAEAFRAGRVSKGVDHGLVRFAAEG